MTFSPEKLGIDSTNIIPQKPIQATFTDKLSHEGHSKLNEVLISESVINHILLCVGFISKSFGAENLGKLNRQLEDFFEKLTVTKFQYILPSLIEDYKNDEKASIRLSLN